MNVKYENFVGVYTDVYPEGYCEYVIEKFKEARSSGAGGNRLKFEGAAGHVKSDYSLSGMDLTFNFNFNDENGSPIGMDLRSIFFTGLQNAYTHYSNEYSIIKNMPMNSYNMKVQCTTPGQGYHVWHCEQGPKDHTNRGLVYILYLNTIKSENAGETEFLYQQKRYQPVKNTLLIFPAAFTHTHRGNTVFGDEDKYIATGWFHIT